MEFIPFWGTKWSLWFLVKLIYLQCDKYLLWPLFDNFLDNCKYILTLTLFDTFLTISWQLSCLFFLSFYWKTHTRCTEFGFIIFWYFMYTGIFPTFCKRKKKTIFSSFFSHGTGLEGSCSSLLVANFESRRQPTRGTNFFTIDSPDLGNLRACSHGDAGIS